MVERFDYLRASSVPHAIALLNEPGVRSRPLAGGTDLVLLMREPPRKFERVIDISLIPELHKIEQIGNKVVVGTAVTFSEAIASTLIQQTATLLVQACQQVGATQIRNMGTLGGNVANAAACADTLPALVCLDATAVVVTPDYERQIPVTEVVLGPNRTIIPPGGLITALSYTIPEPGSRSTFIKLGRRNAMAISRLTIAALGRQDNHGRIIEARLVPGSVTPQIRRFSRVEQSLIGEYPNDVLFNHAANLAIEEMVSMTGRRWSSEFKEPALSAMTRRALAQIYSTVEETQARSA